MQALTCSCTYIVRTTYFTTWGALELIFKTTNFWGHLPTHCLLFNQQKLCPPSTCPPFIICHRLPLSVPSLPLTKHLPADGRWWERIFSTLPLGAPRLLIRLTMRLPASIDRWDTRWFPGFKTHTHSWRTKGQTDVQKRSIEIVL